MGLDVSCSDGDTVLTPFDVNVTGLARPYKNNKNPAINNGVSLSGQGKAVNVFIACSFSASCRSYILARYIMVNAGNGSNLQKLLRVLVQYHHLV